MATYKINKGDTLSQIAKKNGTTVSEIAKLNGISDPNRIRAGATLNLPGASAANPTTPAAAGASTAPASAASVSWSQQQQGSVASPYPAYAGSSPTYSPSSDLTDMWEKIKAYEGQKPGEYKSSYDEQIKALLDKIENREDFNYDVADDPLYNVYKDQYTAAGQTAMQDTMGNAAALTGGYGSSYGQQVGQQTYQGYMQELTAKIPELAQNAYQQYQAEGAAMFDKIGLYQNLDAADYAKYTAQLDDYYNQLGVYMNQYNLMSNEELARYQSDLAAYQADRDYQYKLQQAAAEQSRWEQEFSYKQSQDALDQSNWEQEFSLKKNKSSSGSGSGGSGDNVYMDLPDAMDYIQRIYATTGGSKADKQTAAKQAADELLLSGGVKTDKLSPWETVYKALLESASGKWSK